MSIPIYTYNKFEYMYRFPYILLTWHIFTELKIFMAQKTAK